MEIIRNTAAVQLENLSCFEIVFMLDFNLSDLIINLIINRI